MFVWIYKVWINTCRLFSFFNIQIKNERRTFDFPGVEDNVWENVQKLVTCFWGFILFPTKQSLSILVF